MGVEGNGERNHYNKSYTDLSAVINANLLHNEKQIRSGMCRELK